MEKHNTIRVFGKWILAGEYSVLKSYPALAFPLYSHFVQMDFVRPKSFGKTTISAENILYKNLLPKKKATPFKKLTTYANKGAFHNQPLSSHIKNNFSSLLDQALQKVGKTRTDLSCDIHLQSRMVFGGGMGGSAVLCVLVGRLFQHIKWLKAKELFDFCHNLENHLHGQSSGLDIAVILKGKPVLYRSNDPCLKIPVPKSCYPKKNPQKKQPQIKIFQPLYQPAIFLSYAGPGKTTKENIKQIKIFWKNQPEKARALNQQMNKAVLKALESLTSKSSYNQIVQQENHNPTLEQKSSQCSIKEQELKFENRSALEQKSNQGSIKEQTKRLSHLKKAFSLAENCFSEWNLINPQMKQHIAFLKKQGALAVKPSGSGSGGYVLSLWPAQPPTHLKPLLIPAV